MSTPNNEKVYVNAIWLEEKVFNDGGSILKANIKVDELIKFLKDNKDSEGRVKLVISRKKNVEAGKSTHYATLDTWKPSQTGASSASKPKTKTSVKETPTEQPLI